MKNIKIGLLIFGLILLNSCKDAQKNNIDKETQSELEVSEKSNLQTDKDLVIGSWKDTSESALHFTLFADGTAQSDNMATLLYKNWRLDGNTIIFTIESIGNKTSSTDEEVYEIQKLDENELILKKENRSYKYIKSNKKDDDNEKFVMIDTEEVNEMVTKEKQNLSAQDVMKLYYPLQAEGVEGNEKIEIAEKISDNGNAVVTLIHDNLLDDSVKGEKHIMELKRAKDRWTVVSIKKNWKCRKDRGHTDWGIKMCK
ncbi:lipocalin family protein [Flavobacterium frigoris]|uniref:Lipocalin-like n=1 Tax=Flavobacterium frigoris TaxID=229204 RepID=A0A1H9R6Q1_FLAFI|nr:lipocalin family protein [Flavobacterium frigoris]SER67623.1 Lipocalin-like [Flavobacterium frigoris]